MENADTRLTRTGALVGTVGYVSPEQMRGDTTDPRSDVFGFGVLAYELLSGVRPFPGETFAAVSYQLLYESPKPLGEVWQECPDRRLPDLVAHCLEKWPDRRWRSMDEVVRTLGDIRETLGQGRHRMDRLDSRRRAVLGATLAGPALLVILVPASPVSWNFEHCPLGGRPILTMALYVHHALREQPGHRIPAEGRAVRPLGHLVVEPHLGQAGLNPHAKVHERQ